MVTCTTHNTHDVRRRRSSGGCRAIIVRRSLAAGVRVARDTRCRRENGGRPAHGVRVVPETGGDTARAGLLGGQAGPGRRPGAAGQRAAVRGRVFRRAVATARPT